jgi:proline iminopeptidase
LQNTGFSMLVPIQDRSSELSSLLILSTLLSFALTACGQKSDSPAPAETARISQDFNKEVTAENYLSGKAFCAEYSEHTSREVPMKVMVPEDYTQPGGPTFEVYAWTLRTFNPALPSVVMVDGGPGQNSHGFGASLGSDWNEIHFDQRGLGCSAPETFEKYKDQKYFSTANTVRDMDEIRKAYKIDRWSVFGVSYGTVPATEYASLFKSKTIALSLEGTVNSAEDMHSSDWKVDKWNIVLSQLNEAQQKGFGEMIVKEKYQPYIFNLLHDREFQAEGFRKTLSTLNQIIDADGKVNYEFFDAIIERQLKWKEERDKKDRHSKYAQTPMGIDIQVHLVIYCKDLGYEKVQNLYLYDLTTLRFRTAQDTGASAACDKVGVNRADRKYFKASDFPVLATTTYFQGSHDGATLARGAFKHYSLVPKEKANFILNKKGGHNPLSYSIADLEGTPKDLIEEHRKLFAKSLNGKTITNEDIARANKTRTGGGNNPGLWILIDKNLGGEAILKAEMDGIRRFAPSSSQSL